jgi:sarcosine oxidase / L-pipecolate oxidase
MDWIICPHPHATNLFLATGGSFHGAKFLPNIGKYVVQMMAGELDEKLAEIWAWDKPVPEEPTASPYHPSRDYKADILED